jgi:hypothetical protein
MIHLRDELSFTLKALFRLRIEKSWRNEFDRYVAIEQGIRGAIDDSHSASAKLRFNIVPTQKPCVIFPRVSGTFLEIGIRLRRKPIVERLKAGKAKTLAAQLDWLVHKPANPAVA